MPPQFGTQYEFQNPSREDVKKVRTKRDLVCLGVFVFYFLLLVAFGIGDWNKAGGWGLAAIGVVFLVVFIAFIYTLIIGMFGWKNFTNIESGFVIGFVANWFFVFAVLTKHSTIETLNVLFSSAYLAIIPMALMALLYLVKIVLEYRRRNKISQSRKFLISRLIMLVVFIIIIVSGHNFFDFKAKNQACINLIEENKTSGIIVPLPPYCNKSTSTDQFANWKTYTDREYGFEIKYPSTWKQCWRSGNLTNQEFILTGAEQKCFLGDSIIISAETEIFKQYSTIANLKNALEEAKISIDKIFRISGRGLFEVGDVKEIAFNNILVLQVKQISPIGYDGGTGIYIFYNQKLIKITHALNSSSAMRNGGNQILSTFKFISTSTPAKGN